MDFFNSYLQSAQAQAKVAALNAQKSAKGFAQQVQEQTKVLAEHVSENTKILAEQVGWGMLLQAPVIPPSVLKAANMSTRCLPDLIHSPCRPPRCPTQQQRPRRPSCAP